MTWTCDTFPPQVGDKWNASRAPADGALAFDPREALRLLSRSGSTTLGHAKLTHGRILRSGLSHDPALLRLYSSHCRFDLAARLLATFPDPPTIAWNLMIRAHTSAGAPLDAVLLYNRMLSRGLRPDKFTFSFVVKACSMLLEVSKGKEVHAFAIKSGFWPDTFLQNALIHLYFCCGDPVSGRKVVVSWTALLSGLVACGEVDSARTVFDTMPIRNVVTWTAMIDGYARNGRPDEAFRLFRRMQDDDVMPNEFTVVALLIAVGRWVHEFAQKNGGLDKDVYVGTALIDMYSKCGSLEDASVATWNSMITSFGVHGRGKEAVALFMEMEKAKVLPDGITFVGVLSACVRECMVEEACRFFGSMVERYGIGPSQPSDGVLKLLGLPNTTPTSMATRENKRTVKISDQPMAAEERSWAVEIDDQHKNTGESVEKQQSPKPSIYIVPPYIRNLNCRAYKPQIVSFGPYHHGDPNVMPMEGHKDRARIHFLKRANKSLKDVMTAMAEVVQQLRGAYQSLDEKWAEDERFLHLMILDGCFMLEIIRVATKKLYDGGHGYEKYEPIFSDHGNLYTVPFIRRDMMMIENQLPLLVLYKLVFLEGRCDCVAVNKLVLEFWDKKTLTVEEARPHLLDMLRLSRLVEQSSTDGSRGTENSPIVSIIRSASELREAGIRFKKSTSDSLLDIQFNQGVLSLPNLTVDDNTEYMFLNLMAFECLNVGTGNEVTSYVVFMDSIIDSAKDVSLLQSKDIIQNAFGSDDAAAELFNRLSKDVVIHPQGIHGVVYRAVKEYFGKRRNRWLANLKHTHFSSPWSLLSLLAAILLLVLTVLQTIYTLLQFYHPPSA
ncbi:Pentatricopeptide repeat-containing protein [Musa troglodytarum]|uniref:Pentatricopeptide repeat-containing protein n=1 Tax=Musa troglodytarum TaxID=320322 RepID=A0A9E7EV83_9LILI|nr:Pentatricopeptide repeat-containing protein [Musa troglodytarum]